MDNVQFMQIFNTGDNLMEELACFRFFDSLVLNDVIKEFTTTCILHNKVQLFWGFDNL